MTAALHRSEPPAPLDNPLAAHAAKSLLRFITCGSVDDGKSTLIGRLLWDSRALADDQRAALALDQDRARAEQPDFASLVDGLVAEREQGITIDVAYRFFATATRKFIVADTPGHEQYTRNMVTGASTADAAVILVDARKGVLVQTRRHSILVGLLGIRRAVLVVNKMDLVGYDEAVFDRIVAEYRAFAAAAGLSEVAAIPVAARHGDNVTARSHAMPWYRGPALLEQLESLPAADRADGDAPFRMAVQWVNRPSQDFRGYAGIVASGAVRPGDKVAVLPSATRTSVERIVTADGDLQMAVAGQAITLTLADEVDCSRGDVLTAAFNRPRIADRIDATLVWMAAEALIPGRAYWLKIGARTVSASVARIVDRLDVDTGAGVSGGGLDLNDIGRCELVLDRPVAAIRYAESRALGGFILIDRATNATVAAGLVEGVPDAASRSASAYHAVGRILWLTGASGGERLAFARRFARRLRARGRPSLILDDDALASGLNADLRAGPADQPERERRIRELARLLSANGLVVLVVAQASGGTDRPGTAIDVGAAAYAGDWVI